MPESSENIIYCDVTIIKLQNNTCIVFYKCVFELGDYGMCSCWKVLLLPDLQVHDHLPLVHVLCVNLHPVHSERLRTHR